MLIGVLASKFRFKHLFSRFVCTPQRPDRLCGPNGYWVLFPREADHSSTSSGEVMNDGAVPPLPRVSSWPGAD
jgi:hypothetical protein